MRVISRVIRQKLPSRLVRALVLALLLLGPQSSVLSPSVSADADLDRERVDVSRISSYTMDRQRRRVPAPLGYEWIGQITCAELGCEPLRGPTDLFLDEKGQLYVVDTRTNRIVRFTPGASEAFEIAHQDGPGVLAGPEGVFVRGDGTIYATDTGNSRLVRFSAEGEFEAEYPAPVSPLLDPSQAYRPSKVIRDDRGYIYVLESGGDFRGILVLDEMNTFRGFFAANRVGFQFWNWLARFLATEEQRIDMMTIRPEVQSCSSTITASCMPLRHSLRPTSSRSTTRSASTCSVKAWPTASGYARDPRSSSRGSRISPSTVTASSRRSTAPRGRSTSSTRKATC
jgi:DNA-binding beta-propeller fold protein YncE